MQIKNHEYADIFPMMGEAELNAIVEDMRKNGFDEHAPIVTYQGKILDGRNRYKAAQLAGVKPDFIEYTDDDPLAYVIRHNLTRRHLNESQRAVVAGRLANMTHSDGAKITNSKKNAYANLQERKAWDARGAMSQSRAAEMLNVSPRTVATVKAVEKAAPELIEKIERGEMTAHEAQKTMKAKERNEKRSEMAQAGAKVKSTDKWHVYHGDIATWKAPRQYDFIITDPPYPKEFLPLWETLAIHADEFLKPGGLLIAMSGQSYLDEIYAMMSKHMDYYWTASYLTPGQPTPLRQVNVNSTWKPLLIYSKGKYTGKIFGDVFVSGGNDKDHHKWGQSVSGMYDIISKVCLEGQYILDPFCGAGTTGLAALKHGCFFDGLELDIENVNISKGRLNDASK